MNENTHGTSRPGNGEHAHSQGIESLGEGYDDLDQRLDARLSSTAHELRSTPIPEGFLDRVFDASIETRNEAEAPLSFTRGLPRRQPAVLKLVALAACLGIAATAALWLVNGQPTRNVSDSVVALEIQTPESPLATDALSMSSEAEWAMLASSRDHRQLERLSALVVTRDMGFGDVTGDLASVIDAIHDPRMQTFDLEWQR